MDRLKIYIVGIGMDGDRTLTGNAREIISSADVLIGAKRMLEPFSPLQKPTLECWRADVIRDFLSGNEFETAAVLTSGDCGFFSGAKSLLEALGEFETEIVCGISSPVYFCSRIKKPWQNMKFITLHGAGENIVRNVRKNELCFFLLGGSVTSADVCRRLCGFGMGETRVYIGENLSYKNEKIYVGKASDFTEAPCGGLSVLVTENPDFERGAAVGIPDEEFIRGGVPMTKSEVRCSAVSKLSIGENDVCWDVGCGTGSVSVEMALQCPSGTVFAADKSSEAIELTRRNSVKFGCDNVKIFEGSAPEILKNFPVPQRVFIGGSDGKTEEILSAVFEKNPAASVVMTAVSLETLENSRKAFEKFGINCEILQLSVTKTKKIGAHTMLNAENPVFIISGKNKI